MRCLLSGNSLIQAMTGHMGKSVAGVMTGILSTGYPLVTGGWFLDGLYGEEQSVASGFYGYFGSFWRNKRFEDDDIYLINL